MYGKANSINWREGEREKKSLNRWDLSLALKDVQYKILREGKKEQVRSLQGVDLQTKRARIKEGMHFIVGDWTTQGIQEH